MMQLLRSYLPILTCGAQYPRTLETRRAMSTAVDEPGQSNG